MRLSAQIFLTTLFIGGASLPLLAQSHSSGAHLSERALDALTAEKPKWWNEVQRIMRDTENSSLKMEMVQYVLSRSFIWKESDPRDSETRSAILMLAEDVAVSLTPTLGSMPDSSLIITSDAYRGQLLTTLHTAKKSNIVPTDTINKGQPTPESLQPPAPKKWQESMPIQTPKDKTAPPTQWGIIAAAFGLLFLLLRRVGYSRHRVSADQTKQ